MTQSTKEEWKENASQGRILQLQCVKCKRATKHETSVTLDHTGSLRDHEEGWDVSWQDNYQIVKCRGCENVSFRHVSWFSENPGDESTERLYPKRSEATISAKGFRNVSATLRRIYVEVVDCFNNENLTLCAAGLRAVVEGICADQKIADGPVSVPAKGGGTQIKRRDNLEGKIAGLHEKGLLTAGSAGTLHEHRFLGNEAVHEFIRPSVDELRLAIEIVEHILEQLYEIPEKALKLKKRAGK